MSSRTEVRLTGRQRFRVGIFGKLILQVEYVERYNADPCSFDCSMPPSDGKETLEWRDAKLEDITNEQRDIKPTACGCNKPIDMTKAKLLLEE